MNSPSTFRVLAPLIFTGLLIFQGCDSDPFPVGERQDAGFQVPLVPTYTFDFKTGTGEIFGTQGNLRIVSGADVQNLVTASPGAIAQSADFGVLGGVATDRFGRVLPSVSIGATDAAGQIIRNPDGSVKAGVTNADGQIISNILYNSVNGVPEFINTTGTSPSGSFTGLNVPPGQHFVKAVQGGRGNGRVNIFAGSVSLLDMEVFPVALPTANVAGSVRERDDLVPVGQSRLSFPGLGGAITTNNAGAFSASGFGSESLFLARATAAGHVDTYQQIFTDLGDLTVNAVVPEITRNFTSVSNQDAQQLAAAAGTSLTPGRGMILGKILEAGGRKDSAIVSATDAAGNVLGGIFYFPAGSDFPVCNTPNVAGCRTQTSIEGAFLILNLPPGDVYLKAHAVVDASGGAGGKVKSTGSALASVFSDGVTLVEMTTEVTLRVDPAAAPSPPPPTWYTLALSGTVREEDGLTPVGDVQIRALGFSDALPNANPGGAYSIPAGADPNAVSPLLANSTTLMRLEKAGTHITTYQSLTTGGQDLNADLTLVSSALIGPTNGTGAILGRVINRRLGGRVNEVQILTTQMADQNAQVIETGGAVGTIHYFSAAETLDTTLSETTGNGLFLIRNIPPGLIMIKAASSDDSGNQVVRVFADGVTKVDLPLNHVPFNVPLQGSLSDLHDNPVSGASLSLLGEQTTFTSEALAAFPGVSVPANGAFLTKVKKSGFIDTVNDQLKTGLNAQSGEKFYITSVPELSQFAGDGGLTLDLTKGMVAGEVVEQSISGEAASVSTGASPTAIAAGFFNDDIFPDLAVAHAPDQVQIFLGQASGVFLPATPPSVQVGSDPAGIGVGDFNRDGLADLVVTNRGSNSVSRLFGVGDGKFSLIPPITQGIGTGPGPITVADFNRDGRLDLAIANEGSNNLSVLLGDGSGGFSVNGSPCPIPCAVNGPPTGIAAGDFNGDAILDLAVVTSTGVVSLFWSGEGSINASLTAGTSPGAIAAGDFNGDGFLDLVVANAISNDLSVFIGDGNERFDKVDCLPGPDPAADTIAENCPLAPGGAPSAMLVVDFEQDGDQDLVIANAGTGTLSVMPGKGDGRFDLPSKTFTVGAAPKGLVLSDLNQDGREDLLSLNTGSDDFSVLLSQRSAVAGAVIESRDLEGNRVGVVRYMNDALNVDPGLGQTGNRGRFIVFDLPFGLNTLKGRRAAAPATTALTGNSLVNITALGSLFYTSLRVDAGTPGSVTSVGVTCRPVGVACTKIGKSDISFLGSTPAEFCPPGPDCLSDPNDARYNVLLDPNSSYVVRIVGPDAILPGDTDGDAVPDQTDNCPNVPNPDQVDVNGNQIGDACEQTILDSDGDQLNDDVDNCPFVPNFGQEDNDRDGIGNACDGTPSGKPGVAKALAPEP